MYASKKCESGMKQKDTAATTNAAAAVAVIRRLSWLLGLNGYLDVGLIINFDCRLLAQKIISCRAK